LELADLRRNARASSTSADEHCQLARACPSTDADRRSPSRDALSEAERQELAHLRRENRQLRQERDILAKATAWFAVKGEKTSTGSTNS
jgi:transposase-like protein